MKNKLVLLGIVLTLSAQAQTWVPKFGVKFQSSSYGNKAWHELNYGYFVGIGRNIKLSESVALRTELLYNANVRDIAYTDLSIPMPVKSTFQRRNYISIPILFRKTFHRRKVDWFVEGGVFLGYQFGGSGKDGTYSSVTGWSYETYRIRHCHMATPVPLNGYVYYSDHFSLGSHLGVGAVFNKKFEIELRYETGLANRGVQLSIGIPLK